MPRHRQLCPDRLRGAGKRAVILVVDGNPLTDVSAPRDVTRAVKAGELLVRPDGVAFTTS